MSNKDRIGFLLHTPELINHYQSVWDRLPRGAVEAVVGAEGKDRDEIHARCGAAGIPVESMTDAINRGVVYDRLVSNHPLEPIGGRYPIQRLGRRNIRFMYAMGKAGWNFRPWNQLYDMILCFGPYQAAQLAFCQGALLVQMGYPRFDAFFNRPVVRAEALAAQGGDPARQTVVWLPTWKQLSSIDLYGEAISALTDEYNVIVKVHPMMVTDEPARIQSLARRPFTRLITTAEDNLLLYQLADFVVCDYGGPMFGAVYVDKNLLLLNVPAAETNEFTGRQSPDIVVRQSITNVDPPRASSIRQHLKDSAGWEKQKLVRFGFRQALFAPFFGCSSEVAATALTHAEAMLNTVPKQVKKTW